jgi:hypothetical protein
MFTKAVNLSIFYLAFNFYGGRKVGIKKKAGQKIAEGISELVEKEVEQMRENVIEEPFIQPDLPEDNGKEKEEEEPDPEMERILSSFPAAEGYYGKLYRKGATGKPEFMWFIDHLEQMDDPELEIASLIREKGWRGGEYIVKVVNKNKKGAVQKLVTFYIGSSEQMPVPVPVQTSENPVSNLQGVKETISTVREIIGENKSSPDFSKQLADILKVGVETAKDLTKGTENQNSIIQLLTTLKQMGILGTGDQEKESTLMKTLLPILAEAVKPKTDDDFWVKLERMKELGVISFGEKRNDLLESVDKLKDLLDISASLQGIGGGSDKNSIILKVIDLLVPQVPKLVENITGSINKIAEVSKMKLASRLEPVTLPLSAPLPSSSTKEPTESVEPAEPSMKIPAGVSAEPPKIEEKPMNPVIKQIYDAIQVNDISFYPKLKEIMTLFIGAHVIDSLADNEITCDTFVNQLNMMLNQPFFLEENSRLYLSNFISWYKNERDKGIIIARCNSCKEEVEFDTLDDFLKDSKECENCGGTLEKIEKEEVIGNA